MSVIANEIFRLGLCNADENETAVHGYHHIVDTFGTGCFAEV